MSPYLSNLSDAQPHHLDTELKQEFPHIDEDPVTLPTSLDPFTINTDTGFMPLWPPQVNLPPKFEAVATLVENLPVVKVDGSPGLLATYQLGPTVDIWDALPDLIDELVALVASDCQPDLAAVTAVFRDYAFIASAYLLEPCWERYKSGLEGYGLGRQVLPKAIAGPLVKTAKMYVFSQRKLDATRFLTNSLKAGYSSVHVVRGSIYVVQLPLCESIDRRFSVQQSSADQGLRKWTRPNFVRSRVCVDSCRYG